MQTKIEAYFDDPGRRQTLVEAISRLIRIDSTKGAAAKGAPFGPGPAAALREALDISAQLGLPGENLEGYVGTVDLNEKDTILHILTHLDVVAAGTGWSITQPFTPLYQDGLLYGRGSSDNKGPLVAALLAMQAVKELGVPLKHNARLILGTDEESGFGDISWYYDRHPHAPHCFAPDATFPLTNIEKGLFKPVLRAQWESQAALPRVVAISGAPQVNVVPPKAEAVIEGLTAVEVSALGRKVEITLGVSFSFTDSAQGLHILSSGNGTHGSTPEKGNNALTALLSLLRQLPLAEGSNRAALHGLSQLFPHGDYTGQALGISQSDELSGELTVALTMLELTEHELTARVDCRTCLCATEERTLLPFTEKAKACGFTLEGVMDPPHHTPADSPFVKTLLQCYEQYTGDLGVCLSTGGGTYVHHIPGGVAFGALMPGYEPYMHGPDERIPVEDLLTACKIFTQAIIDLCS